MADPPATDPPAIYPPAIDPPAAAPPAAHPPAMDPPAADPPAAHPPAIDPPAADPPAAHPPAIDPPAADPPTTDPPATDPPATDPPATIAASPSSAAASTVVIEIVERGGACPLAPAESSLSENGQVGDKSETPICRICLDGASSGPLHQVCGCQGTIGRLHHHCLVRWLGLSKKDHCELCLQPLPVLVQQPGLLQYIRVGPRRNHYLVLLDVFSLLLMLPLIVYCNLLSVTALQHFRELQYLKLRQYSFWEICFGVVLTPFVLSGFLLWMCYVHKKHYSDYKRWRLEQRRVTLCEMDPPMESI